SSKMCSPFFPDLKTMSSRPATTTFTGSLFSAGIEKTLAGRQDLRSQICHSLPGGLASATAGGGSRARKVCWLLFRLPQPLLSFSQCSVFLVDGGCPARSGECTSSIWERSLVVSISSFVFLCSIQFVVVSVNCGYLLRCIVESSYKAAVHLSLSNLAFGVEIVTMAIQRSAFRSSYVADLTDLVLLQRNHYGLFMCAGLEWLGIATCFMVVSIKAFIGRVMCCPTRRIQRSLMKINKSLSYWIVKP
ncbi:hypothetical protein HID58_008008, partial [Brassica napus]